MISEIVSTIHANEPVQSKKCSSYTPLPGIYDEMLDHNNQIKPHWQSFIRAVSAMGCDELERNHQEMIRIQRENGIAYNIHGDPQGIHRDYVTDIIPLIFSQKDWEAIESGLKQRTRLLNMILEDLYGPRTLINESIIPPELIYLHKGFLRACDGVRIAGVNPLMIYSADLARGPDGLIRVMKDYTAKPVGVGYTLENRTAMSNVLPHLFKECKVMRLSNFFRVFRSELALAAPFHREQPRVVILTPGPAEETYFEHAYLASYLGFPLVQGEDLTVRDANLWLKSLEGLQPVDVVVRQVEDSDVDSLEFSSIAGQGIPGFIEAMRRGNFVSANIPGSKVLDNPGLLPFLPSIARHFLSEDLMIPSVNTWWCGHSDGLAYVLENLSVLVIKTIHNTEDDETFFGWLLSRAQTEDLKNKIRQNPELYAAQEQMQFSTAPSLSNGVFAPRHVVFRGFMIARHDGDYEVMPGGIARSVREKDASSRAQKIPGILKDIWVLSDQPQKHVSLWMESARPDKGLKRAGILTSRTAENLFWVGRYAERSEAVIHLLRTIINLISVSDRYGDEAESDCAQHLLRSVGRMTLLQPVSPGPDGRFPLLKPDEQIRAVILGSKNPANLSSTLQAMINAAYEVRDHWSNDTWQVVTGIENHRESLHRVGNFLSRSVVYNLNHVITGLNAFTGLCMESMSREPGWMLLDIGRRIERALMFISFIRLNLIDGRNSSIYHMLLEAVLITTENIITYRRRYRSYLDLETVMDLLLLDENNPRSLLYQLNSLRQHIRKLPREQQMYRLSEHERLILKAWSGLRLMEPEKLVRFSEKSQQYQHLDRLLASIKALLERASEAISHTYFSHTQPSRMLSSNLSEPLG